MHKSSELTKSYSCVQKLKTKKIDKQIFFFDVFRIKYFKGRITHFIVDCTLLNLFTGLAVDSDKSDPSFPLGDDAIHRINRYLVDSVVRFVNTYPLDSDLTGG